MTFIDKLEDFLLNSNLEIYFYIKKYSSGEVNAFEILCKDGITNYHIKEQAEDKKDGLKEMIAYLKDPFGLKNRKFTHYCLNFIGYESGNQIFKKILELEPTDEELIHLYKHTAFSFHFKLLHFARAIKNKEALLKIMRLGYDGKYDYTDYKNYLILCLRYLYERDNNISDDESIDIIFNYVKNSISMKETKDYIINIIASVIEDKNKAEKLILDLFGETISLEEEPTENKIIKIVMSDFYLIRKYYLEGQKEVNTFLTQFENEVNRNIELLSDTLNLKYYKQNNRKTNRVEHVLLIDNISENTTEINILLEKYNECFSEEYKKLDCTDKTAKILKENPAIFRKFIVEAFMPPSASKEDRKPIKI
jgi:hypothetical protein